MDPENQRIEEDLRGLLQGEVRCDDLFTQLYSTDASVYEIRPLGVVRPRSMKDVVATVRYAAENNIPIFPRGAGSGLAGESLGRGIVVDFSRHFRRVLEFDRRRVRVQAGVVLATLNRFLAARGLTFGPDPAMSHVTTMGSVVAIDAGGSHWRKYGSARRHVEALNIVLADGEVLKVGRHPVPTKPDVDAGESCPATRLDHLVQSVAGLIERHAKLIAEYRPQSLVNRSGYTLHDVLDDGQLDLAKLLVGSEGTLALILDATVTVDPLPVHRGCALLLFDSLDKAANAVLELLPHEPAACDLMDRRHLNLARENDVRYELLIPGEAEAVLLVEQHGDSAAEARAKIDEIVELLQFKTGLAAAAHVAEDDGDFQLFWGLARRFVPTLYRLQGTTRPVPCIEDMAVPPTALPVFLKHAQDTFKRLQVTASLFGHAGHGQLHIRPFLDLASSDDVATLETLAAELYEKVWLLGGTVSGEHGDGLSRTPYLAAQFGPLTNVFRELKQIFDPQGLLNPGKIVPLATQRMMHDLRPMTIHQAQQAATEAAAETDSRTAGPFALQLRWQPEELMDAARLCNGCGACRSTSPEVRMCPIFRLSPREEASPRAKANLVPRDAHRPLAAGRNARRRLQGGRRPLRPLPHVPARMPGQRRHSQADDGSQGDVRSHERPCVSRSAVGADRLAGRPRRPAAGDCQLGARQSAGPLVAREILRRGPGSQVAAACAAQFPARMPRCVASASRPIGRAKKSCISSTPMRTTSIPSWPKRWSPCCGTMA